MFRRAASAALVTAALVVAAATGTAGASGGQAARDWFHGQFAETSWTTSSNGAVTYSLVLASREQTGTSRGTTHLTLDEFTPSFDANGNVTGGVDLSGTTTSGVSFSIDTVKFTGASTNGVLPLTRCVLDASFDPISCTDAGVLSVAVDWTGQGPIPHEPETFVGSDGDCLFVDHSSTVERQASATIRLGGIAVQPSSSGFSGFGTGNGGLLTVCPHD